MSYDPVADLHSLKVTYSRRAPGYGFPWACAVPSQATRWNRVERILIYLFYYASIVQRPTEVSPIRRSGTASTYQSKVLLKSFKLPRAFVSYHVSSDWHHSRSPTWSMGASNRIFLLEN